MAFRLFRVNFLRTVFRNLTPNQPKYFRSDFRALQALHGSSGGRSILPRTATFDTDLRHREALTSDDPDKFGELTDDEDKPIDEGDVKEEAFTTNRPSKSRQLTTKQYAEIIKDHLQYHRLKEALDVLEVRMLRQDRVKPENYIYNLLISGCARAGYTRKAFQLYNRMKQRDLKVTGGTYTSLFNACSTAPTKEDGLGKANKLRAIMLEKGYEPNVKNYNAMIKAYGRGGDIETAFLLADEMSEKRLAVGVETYNFLLQACASDENLGFRHALLIWHKMIRRNIKPDIYSFNLLLRVVRDCSVGDVPALEDLITKILEPKNPLPYLSDSNRLSPQIAATSSGENSTEIAIVSPENEVDTEPNLLTLQPHLGSLISIGEIQKPEDRLLLLGGQSGFLAEMKKAKVTPGIETFTALLDCIPSTLAAEKQIIAMIRKIGLRADIDFFNVLIKKRSMRLDYEAAKEVLSMIRTAKLQPDIVTYGVLALGCRTRDEARELLQEMRQKKIRMNIQILGAMLKQGTFHRNFDYIYDIMKICRDELLRPNENFLKHLQKFQNHCYKLIESEHPLAKSQSFRKNFTTFKAKYQYWRKAYSIEGLKLEDALKKLRENPYKQFKENSESGFEDLKNEKLQRKQKIRKYIKKIKLDQLGGNAENSSDDGNMFSDTRISSDDSSGYRDESVK